METEAAMNHLELVAPAASAPAPRDPAAFVADLFETHGRMVYGLCRMLLRDPTEAEDAAQQAFLSAHRSIVGGVVPREPAAWLATIARNECRSRARSRMATPLALVDDLDECGEDLERTAGRHEDVRALRAAIAALPPQQRDAVILREFYGLSYHEVAAALDVSHSAAESLLFRSRQRLQEVLAPLRDAASSATAPLALRETVMQLVATASRAAASSTDAVVSAVAAAGAGGAGVATKVAATPFVLKVATLVATATVAAPPAPSLAPAEPSSGPAIGETLGSSWSRPAMTTGSGDTIVDTDTDAEDASEPTLPTAETPPVEPAPPLPEASPLPEPPAPREMISEGTPPVAAPAPLETGVPGEAPEPPVAAADPTPEPEPRAATPRETISEGTPPAPVPEPVETSVPGEAPEPPVAAADPTPEPEAAPAPDPTANPDPEPDPAPAPADAPCEPAGAGAGGGTGEGPPTLPCQASEQAQEATESVPGPATGEPRAAETSAAVAPSDPDRAPQAEARPGPPESTPTQTEKPGAAKAPGPKPKN